MRLFDDWPGDGQLEDLRHHWGDAYDIRAAGGVYTARRRTGRETRSPTRCPRGSGCESQPTTGLTRPGVRLAEDEAGQVMRLARFRQARPDVIIGDGGFGTWQARIPEPDGETVTTRYTLRELLDRLDELTGRQD